MSHHLHERPRRVAPMRVSPLDGSGALAAADHAAPDGVARAEGRERPYARLGALSISGEPMLSGPIEEPADNHPGRPATVVDRASHGSIACITAAQHRLPARARRRARGPLVVSGTPAG